MKTDKARITSLFLVSLILASVFTSCAEKPSDDTQESVIESESSSESESETETTWIDTLPTEIYYEDYSFNIGVSTPYEYQECDIIFEEVALGDIVDEAVYNRNRLAEEKLGIVISAESMCDNWEQSLRTIQSLTSSGDNPYDVFCMSLHYSLLCSIQGLFVELGTVDTLDLTQSWWDQSTTEMHRVGSNSLYFVNGDINYLDDYATACLIFDKQLADEYHIPNLYELVKSGAWTYDKFHEFVQLVYTEGGDTYGYYDNSGIVLHMICGFREHLIVIDETGLASVNTSERCFDIVDKIINEMCGEQSPASFIEYYQRGEPSTDKILFSFSKIGDINLKRATERDFGIIPYPKYDETQQEYGTMYDTAYGTAYNIPIDNTELDRTGYILDVMGYYSHDTIHESVIEKSVLVRNVRDEDSAEMIELLFDHRFYELGGIGTDVYNRLLTMAETGNNTFSSSMRSIQKMTERSFKGIDIYYDFD